MCMPDYTLCKSCGAMLIDDGFWVTKNDQWVLDELGNRIWKTCKQKHQEWHQDLQKELK